MASTALLALTVAACSCKAHSTAGTPAAQASPAAKAAIAGATVARFDMPTCETEPAATPRTVTATGNPVARAAAQRGLGYLATATTDWQQRNDCYGCHVHSFTLEALAVGVHHQYDVGQPQLDAVLKGMLDLKGGARHQTGLGYSSPGHIYDTGKVLGTAAFARYDQWIDSKLSDDLLTNARMLLEMQQATGEVPLPYAHRPVAIGSIQGTAQAVVAWKQAYERSADDQWLTAVSKAEDYLRGVAAKWRQQPPATIQDINFTIMGLLAAGASMDEDSLQTLSKLVLERQNTDGGWALTANGASVPYATGQAMYALRLMGMTDRDDAIARGTSWLVERQQPDGAWSAAGFGKAEAMWGVMGLVSMDVMTIAVDGVRGGVRVSGVKSIAVEATDNGGGKVERVELYIDDIPAFGACGAKLSYDWNTAGLSTGKHLVDIRAINDQGKESRRRLTVYAGDVYMTQIGSRFIDGGTAISLRNIADADAKNQIAVDIFATTERDGVVTPADKLVTIEQAGEQGAMRFFWDGKTKDGAHQPGGKYIARLRFSDASGAVVQTEQLEFVHDTLAAQRARWGEVEGSLALPGEDAAANVDVELVDERGNVVQRTKSTGAGNYRFRNVKAGRKYKVRIKKDGFKAKEATVAPAAAEDPAQADLLLQAD